MAAQQQPYMLAQAIPYYRNLSFGPPDLQQSPTTSAQVPSSVTMARGPSSTLPQASFRAPAHKHAHHLHSIPPREKSTRTLIIDHMLWVHGRTRFAQARAELGMTDRTGGPTSPNYVHRFRPEGYEEDDEQGSEGEDASALKARTGDPNHPLNDDEERSRRQDLSLARGLRLRAEGLEKVITSMLGQPPPIHPLTDDVSPSHHTNLIDLHRLPNGVRLRLALGTIINDLFARQTFHPPYRHTHTPHQGGKHPHNAGHNEHSPVMASPFDLPDVLRSLAPVSGAFVPRYQLQQLPHRHHQTPTTSPVMRSPAYSDFQYSRSSPNPPGSGQMSFQAYHPPPTTTAAATLPRPNQRTKELYFTGSDPSTANCPPALRCPRHLHTGCEICIEAKSPTRTAPTTSGARGRSATNGKSSTSGNWRGSISMGSGSITSNTSGFGSSISGFQEGTGVGSGLLRPSIRGSALRRQTLVYNSNHNNINSDDPTSTSAGGAGSGNTKLSKLIPRFLRLSALVAAELGREARGEEGDGDSEDGRGGPGGSAGGGIGEDAEGGDGTPTSPTGTVNVSTPGRSPWTGGSAGAGGSPTSLNRTNPNSHSQGGQSQSQVQGQTQSQVHSSPQSQASRERSRMYENALRPSREWYLLLAGLLTRAALEGYLTAGWSGLNAVQCLLLVGLGVNEGLASASARNDLEESDDEEDEDAQFAAFDPDELPDLMQAMKILFPSLRDASFGVKDFAEEEYEMEMLERLRRFYDIPPSTPDCSIHMEGLAWQYPAEPVERAAVRYCEAIAKWRGKPELQTYKKKPSRSISLNLTDRDMNISSATSPGGTPPMTIDSFVHSNPASPNRGFSTSKLRKPSIDVYFPQAAGGGGGGRVQVQPQTQGSVVSTASLRTSAGNVSGAWIPITSRRGNNSLKRYRDVDDVGRVD